MTVKKREIARALGVSASAVTKYVKRGCPTTSVAAARVWRDANLDPVRRMAQQMGIPRASRPSASELVVRANEICRLALVDFTRHEPALRSALRDVARLPRVRRGLVVADDFVWSQLFGFSTDPAECPDGEQSLAQWDGPASPGDDPDYFWKQLAGEVGE